MSTIAWDMCYVPSRNVVYREIDGEVVLVPISSGMGDLTDDLFSVNATGKAIWDACDGKTTLREIVERFVTAYDAPRDVIESDVAGFVQEMSARDILVPCED